MIDTSETDVSWDLSDLFAGPDDPKIDATLAHTRERAAAFAREYQGKIDSPDLTAARLASAIREYEALWQEGGKPGMYARLRFSADNSDPARGALMARVQEETTRLSLPLVFYRLELARVADEILTPLLDDPQLAPYRYYIYLVRAGRPHQLSEVEETLLARFSDTGPRAFIRLSGEIRAATVFRPALPDGTTSELNFSQLTALYSSPDRAVRQAAALAFAVGAKANLKTLTFILNTLLQDKAVSDEIRHYDRPEATGFQRDELPGETVELVTGTTAEHYPLAQRYYRLKGKMLGYALERLRFGRAACGAAEEAISFRRSAGYGAGFIRQLFTHDARLSRRVFRQPLDRRRAAHRQTRRGVLQRRYAGYAWLRVPELSRQNAACDDAGP